MKNYKLIKKYPGIGIALEIDDVTHINEDKSYGIRNIHDSEWNENYFQEYPEFWEEINEPLYYTNEDEVYYDGKITSIYDEKEEVFILFSDLSHLDVPKNMIWLSSCKIIDGKLYNGYDSENPIKTFTTLNALLDYKRLQEAIKKSGLKVGYIFDLHKTVSFHKNISNKNKGEYNITYSNIHNTVTGFKIVEDIPCVMIQTLYKRAISLSDFPLNKEPKLTFGGKLVTLEHKCYSGDLSTDVIISCDDENATYTNCKKFYEAIQTIKTFTFGRRGLVGISEDVVDESLMAQPHQFKKLKIGCTTGTIEEIEAILSACKELLK